MKGIPSVCEKLERLNLFLLRTCLIHVFLSTDDTTKETADGLKHLAMPLYSYNECRETSHGISSFVKDRMLCAGGVAGQDACKVSYLTFWVFRNSFGREG